MSVCESMIAGSECVLVKLIDLINGCKKFFLVLGVKS